LLDVEDVLKEFDHLSRIRMDSLDEKVDLSETEKVILRHLSDAPKSAEKLSELMKKSYVELCSILTILEIKGYLTELNGGIFSLK
ncbi:DprA-like winged helix domain-containing protein, partial [Bacillus licheniformis]|uniref:DprA-like winged helix domain-containing protein n=1 Tax=Bacillus licheniformis TaxID=1402 RepID=UPI001C891E5D